MKLGKIITFSSLKTNIGKTFIIRNLAGALAEEGKKVLILDFNKNEEDFFNFFGFQQSKYMDLTYIQTKDISLQSVKNIYEENRGITVIPCKENELLEHNNMINVLKQIKKTYDFILFELPFNYYVENKNSTQNINLNLFLKQVDENIIVIDQELSSIKEINYLKENLKHIKNHVALINKCNLNISKNTGQLINIEDLFKIINLKFLGIIELNTNFDTTLPTFKTPHLDVHIALNRIAKRLIKQETLEKISTLDIKPQFRMDILYKTFDIIHHNNINKKIEQKIQHLND